MKVFVSIDSDKETFDFFLRSNAVKVWRPTLCNF